MHIDGLGDLHDHLAVSFDIPHVYGAKSQVPGAGSKPAARARSNVFAVNWAS